MDYPDKHDAMLFIGHIKKMVQLDEVTIDAILKCSKEILISKGQIISHHNNVNSYVYFMLSGKARTYYVDRAGKAITLSLHFNENLGGAKNLFIVDHGNFVTQAQGAIYIEALSDMKVIRVGQRDLELQSNFAAALGDYLGKLNESAFSAAYERIFNLLTLSASDRYQQLLRNEPHLLQMFADKYLASYIGIEPQSLSRIRKNLSLWPVPANPLSYAGRQ